MNAGSSHRPYRPPGSEGVGGRVGVDPAGCTPNQSVLVSAATNARDLGGTPLEGGGRVACGQLFRGAPLSAVSGQACADFNALGIRTVLDLRTPDERLVKPDSDCVARNANLIFAPLPIPYDVSPQAYIADLNALPMTAALHELGDEGSYPVYFHCTWGRDRTGVLGAVILSALGASREAILQEYMLSEQSVGAFPNSLLATLDEIERRGGIEAYLTAAGISEAELATLRARAIAPQ